MSLKSVLRRRGEGVHNPAPLVDVAPFWEPIPEAELWRYGARTAFDDVADRAGWIAARFLITTPEGQTARTTVVGYVRGVFGVYTCTVEGRNVALLVHLPSGYVVSRAIEDDVILFIADVIAGALDWANASVEAITEASAAYTRPLTELGLRCIRIPVAGLPLIVWVRNPAQNAPHQEGEAL